VRSGVRIGSAGKEYTPRDYQQLFADTGLTLAQKIASYYFGVVKFRPPFFPDVYAEKGSGLATPVGIQLPTTPGLRSTQGPTRSCTWQDGSHTWLRCSRRSPGRPGS
jgi:hypothetical protein